MTNYQIATILSVITALFTAASGWVPDRKKTFQLQTAQCLIYAVASYFFGMYATIVTVLLCSWRNWMESNERFTVKICVPFCILVTLLGLIMNRAGLTGLLPVAATLLYSVGCCVFKDLLITKANILVNLLLWTLYDLLIADYPSLIMDSIGAAVAAAAMLRIRKMSQSPEKQDIS